MQEDKEKRIEIRRREPLEMEEREPLEMEELEPLEMEELEPLEMEELEPLGIELGIELDKDEQRQMLEGLSVLFEMQEDIEERIKLQEEERINKSDAPLTISRKNPSPKLLKPSNSRRITEDLELDPDDILGEGIPGSAVYRGRYQERPVAIKRMSKDYFNLAERESDALLMVDRHNNIIRFFQKFTDAQFIYIVLELGKCSLKDTIKADCPITLSIKDICYGILNGLLYLHSSHRVHRDIKPANILICDSGGKLVPKIADFGLCKRKKTGMDTISLSTLGSETGTLGYIAPEIATYKSGDRVDEKVDIFSTGITMSYCYERKGIHPFLQASIPRTNFLIAQKNIKEGLGPYLDDLIGDGDSLFKHLLAEMLKISPSDRLSAEELLRHIYFWNDADKMDYICKTSDAVMSKVCRCNSYAADLANKLENNAQSIIGMSWMTMYDADIQRDLILERRSNYATNEIKGLMRSIRNLVHHIDEKSTRTKELFGSTAEDQIRYISSKFPEFLLDLYLTVKEFISGFRDEEIKQSQWLQSINKFFKG